MLNSSRSLKWLLAIIMPALALPARAAEVNKYLPDGTDVVVVLNVKQILGSPLMQKHGGVDQLRTLIKSSGELNKHFEAMGFDPLKDLSRVTIGAVFVKEEPKAIIVVEGSFDLPRLERAAVNFAEEHPKMVKIHHEGKQTVYEFKQEQSGDKPNVSFVGAIDKSTIVASNDKQYVLDALAKATGKTGSLKKEVRELVEKEDADQSFWFVVPSSSLVNSELGNNPEARKTLDRVENITGHVSITQDVKMALNFLAKSPDAAKALAQEVKEQLDQAKGFVSFMAANKKELAPAIAFVEAMKVEALGKNVTIKAHATEEAIEKAIKNN
jgi:hypothetical protein